MQGELQSFFKEKALLGFDYLIHNYLKKNTTIRDKKRKNERKGIIPKGASTKETKGPMKGAAQVETVVKEAKNQTVISAYVNMKRKNVVCRMACA